jgi:hypothetical protein
VFQIHQSVICGCEFVDSLGHRPHSVASCTVRSKNRAPCGALKDSRFYEALNAIAIAVTADAERYAPEIMQKARQVFNQAQRNWAGKVSPKLVVQDAREAAQTPEDARVVAERRRQEEQAASAAALIASSSTVALAFRMAATTLLNSKTSVTSTGRLPDGGFGHCLRTRLRLRCHSLWLRLRYRVQVLAALAIG